MYEADISVAGKLGPDVAGKYLTFALSTEKYGVRILKVQEIIGIMHITPVPRSPHYMKGVINLRGRIIPVVDLRLRLSLLEAPYDEKTCIIVVHVKAGADTIPVGVIVDTVLEVCTFQESMIEPAPDYGASDVARCILGIGTTEDNNIVILIDIEKALDAGSLSEAAGQKNSASRTHAENQESVL